MNERLKNGAPFPSGQSGDPARCGRQTRNTCANWHEKCEGRIKAEEAATTRFNNDMIKYWMLTRIWLDRSTVGISDLLETDPLFLFSQLQRDR